MDVVGRHVVGIARRGVRLPLGLTARDNSIPRSRRSFSPRTQLPRPRTNPVNRPNDTARAVDWLRRIGT